MPWLFFNYGFCGSVRLVCHYPSGISINECADVDFKVRPSVSNFVTKFGIKSTFLSFVLSFLAQLFISSADNVITLSQSLVDLCNRSSLDALTNVDTRTFSSWRKLPTYLAESTHIVFPRIRVYYNVVLVGWSESSPKGPDPDP